MKKRPFALLLSLLLALSALSPALALEAASLPAVGEELYGFRVTEHGELMLLSAPTVLLEHVKTGAQVFFIQTPDINRAFDITFRTPALDNTGLPHAYEHITISGSEKYPSPNLFFPMATQTYNTFVNAMTFDTHTTYPLSSLSEDQLLKMADVYLDGVFHPLILTEERLFRREAWRYELESRDAPLTINGTVYNEMKGARTQPRIAELALADALYPDTTIGNEYGGDPDFIPDMTYQMLLDFHAQYYHPSNALVILYGDLQLERFLQFLDENYFSAFDRQEITIDIGPIDENAGTVTKTVQFPVERGSTAQNAAQFDMGFALSGISPVDEMALMLLSGVLSHESSPLVSAVRGALPSASVVAEIDTSFAEPFFAICVNGINEEDAPIAQEAIETALAAIRETGVDRETIDVINASLRFDTLTMPESPQIGLNASISLLNGWAREGTLDYLNRVITLLQDTPQLAAEGYYDDLFARCIVENDRRALVTTVPVPGLKEQQTEAFEAKMAEIKASMTDAELDALMEAGEDLAAFSAQEAPSEMVQSLKALEVESLPEEVETYAIDEQTLEGGVRVLTAEANVPEIGLAKLMLDTSAIAPEELPYLMLYADLMGNLSTTGHTRDELTKLLTRHTYSLSTSALMQEGPKDVYTPTLTVSWMGLSGEHSICLDLIQEMLFETQFEELNEIDSIIKRTRNSLRMIAAQMPLYLQQIRTPAYFAEHYAYDAEINGLAAYQHLAEIEALLQDSPEQVVEKLENIQQMLKNKQNAIVLFAGNDEGTGEFLGALDGFLAQIPASEIVPADLSALARPEKREAIALDSQVQFNMLYAPLEELGLEYSGILSPFSLYLYDAYLTPNLRHGLGAYDSIASISEDGILLSSYRDPGIADTYAVLEAMPAFVAQGNASQEDLDGYIMHAYSAYALPQGQLGGAADAINRYLLGKTPEEKLERMREMKAFSPDDFEMLSQALATLLDVGARSTAGSAAAIEENAELFDQVLRME